MLRTANGRLRVLWRCVYAVLIRAVAAAMRVAGAEAVYVRGSFATASPVYGLSDLDIVAVMGSGASAARVRRGLARVYDSVPTARHVVEASALSAEELAQVCVSPFLTYPWDPRTGASAPRARFFGNAVSRERFGARPDGGARLYGPLRRWSLVAGTDLAAQLPPSPETYHRLWVWLELQFFWKHAFRICARPSSFHASYFSTKVVAEGLRVWLWHSQGLRLTERNQTVLERAVELVPEEARAVRVALELLERLPSAVDPPLEIAIGCLWRVSSRIARDLRIAARSAGATEVRLLGGDDASLPLLDWRALALPEGPEETFLVLPGDPSDPTRLGEVARSDTGDPHHALRGGDLLVLPNAQTGSWPLATAALRAIQCPQTDPVSFAVLGGQEVAAFPDLPGWSAGESAQRATLEHRAWLERDQAREPSQLRRLGMLWSSARAAFFSESVSSGSPELALTLAATATQFAEHAEHAQGIAEAALDQYLTSRANGREPVASCVSAFQTAVGALGPYASRTTSTAVSRPRTRAKSPGGPDPSSPPG